MFAHLLSEDKDTSSKDENREFNSNLAGDRRRALRRHGNPLRALPADFPLAETENKLRLQCIASHLHEMSFPLNR